MKKKFLSVIMCAIILLSNFELSSFAATVCYTNFYSADYSTNPGQYMVNIAKAQLGRDSYDLGYNETAWCAFFVIDCARVAGQTSAIPTGHGRCDNLWAAVIKAGGKEVYSGELKAGDLIFYDCSECDTDGDGVSLQHVGIVSDEKYSYEGNLSNIVKKTSSFSHNGGSHSTSNGIVKRRYLRPNYTGVYSGIPEPVTNLKSDKKVYNSSESIHFTWDAADGAENYWIYLWRNGEQLFSHNCGSNTSFTQAPSGSGEYTLIIRPGNSYGFNESSVPAKFVVTNSVPEPVDNLTSDKKVYKTSESIYFYWDEAYGAEKYIVYLWKDGKQLYSYDCGGKTYFTQAPSSEGEYTLAIRPGNINGYNESSGSYSFVVNNGYEIIYNANGGSGAPSAQTKTYDTALKLSSTKPTRTGYTFTGWNTKADGSGVNYAAGASYTSNAALTLYAQWKINTFAVSYNANGGSSAPSAQTKTYGAALTLSSTKPTRTGYTFAGWNTKADGSGTSYAAGASYTANSAVTLYAQWTANPYTVTFNANGGTCSTASMSVTYNSTYGTLPTPTRTGYTFNGWYTAASGGTKVTADTKVTITTAQTLYAQWTVNTYTIAFNGNGSTSGSMSNLSMTYGTAKNLTANVFAKTGYTFNGWNTKSDGSGTAYADKVSVNNLTSTNGASVTLYAQWKINTFAVSYNANGGSGAPSAQTKTYGAALTLSSTKPTRTGYTFTGWNTKADGSGTTYASGASYTANSAVTLYAQWTANTNTKYIVNHYQMNVSGSGYTLKETENKTGTTASSVTVANLKKSYTGFTYEGGKGATEATATKPSALDTTTTVLADGTRVINLYYSRNKYALTLNKGTGISTVTGGGTYYYGQSVTIDATVSTGYTWLKWSDNNTTKNATLTMPANALTLTANATLNTYTISYALNGGTVVTANPESYNITTAAFTLSNPTRTGYTFAGWTGTGLSAATKTVTVAKGSTGNRAYTATWTANTYTVTFDASGGTTATANKTVTYDSTYGTLPVPTRTGYTFKGWYIAKTGGTKITADTKATITSAQTLYAQWTVNTYTIAFNANNGSGTMSNLAMTYGVAKNLTANGFTRAGYTFNGWNTKADGSGITYTDKASVNNLTSTNGATVTLYAQWKINTFAVTYNANGGSGAPSAQTKNYGTDLVLSSTQPTRTDYIFTGWNTRADGTGVSYQPGDKYTDNKAVTLYAIWELAHKHVYISSVTKQPTCTEKGIKKFTCSSCGDTYTEDIAALGHNHIGSVTEPTCTEQGYTTYICLRCNDSYIDNYTNSLNHPSSTWHTAVNPTPASNGLAEKRCDYCNHVLEQFVIPNLNPDYVTGISLSSQKETVEIGDVFTLTANIIPDTAKNKNVIWSSRNPDIVTVDSGVVRAVKPGTTAIVAESEDGGYIDFCLVRVVGLVAINGAVIDNDSNIVYGLTCNLNSVDDYLEPVDDNMSISLGTATVGTGTTISIIDNGEVVDSYEAIIFGDVNGDGWYDGEDAFMVNLVAKGLLTEEDVGTAIWTAADCNHDGVIDEADVDLLSGAGLKLNDVDQSATQAELETNVAYIEYIGLIDQSTISTPDYDVTVENIPDCSEIETDNIENTADEFNIETIIANVLEFIKNVFTFIFSLIVI